MGLVLTLVAEHLFDRRVERRLIVLDRQDIIPAPVHDLLRDVLLAPHGVDGHHRTLHVDPVEEGRNGRDLVRFLLRRHLPQRQAVVAGPGADQMQGAQPLVLILRATQGLAVDGDHPGSFFFFVDQARNPRLKTGLKGFGPQGGKNPATTVPRRKTMRKGQHALEPFLLGPCPAGDGRRPRATRHDPTDRNRNHLHQQMPTIAVMPRVRQRLEVLDHRTQTDRNRRARLRHRSAPSARIPRHSMRRACRSYNRSTPIAPVYPQVA